MLKIPEIFFKAAATVFSSCGLFACIQLTAADIYSDVIEETPSQIVELAPVQSDVNDINRLGAFVKAFTPRIFGGMSNKNDVDKLFDVLLLDIHSDQLLSVILGSARKNPEVHKYVFERINTLAMEYPDSPFLNIVAGENLLGEGRVDEALKCLDDSFRVLASSGVLPARETFARTAMYSAFTKLIGIYSARMMEDEERLLLNYMNSNEDFASDPVLMRDLLIARHLAYANSVNMPSPPGMFMPNMRLELRNKLDSQIDDFLTYVGKYGLPDDDQQLTMMQIVALAGRIAEFEEPLLERLLNNSGDSGALKSLGQIALSENRPHDAARFFRAAIMHNPASEGETCLVYAEALRKSGQYEQALAAYQLAAKLMPNLAGRITRDIIALHMERKEYMRALELISKIPSNPASAPDKMFLTIICYSELHDYKRAYSEVKKFMTFLEKNFSFAPNNNFWYLVGAVAEKARDMKFIETHIESKLEKDAADGELYNFVGYTYADHSYKLPEARKYIAKALELDPENYAILDSMAWVLYRLGDYAESWKYMEKSIAGAEKEDKLDAVLCEHAGDILLKLDKVSEALSYWYKALDLTGDIDYKLLRDKIDKLEKSSKDGAG